jgi:hypothetical protein
MMPAARGILDAMRARGWLVVVALALCAGGLTPAHAAAPRQPTGTVVATDGTVELVATDSADQLCLEIRDSSSDMRGQGCGEPEAGAATSATSPEHGVQFVGVAVPAAAASVEVRRLGKLVGGGITVAGEAYKGAAAGSVRFALARLAPKTPYDALRVHAKDAAGTLIAVVDVSGSIVLDRRRLLSGRAGLVRWSLVEQRTSSLAPTAIDPAHETLSRCVGVDISVRSASGGSGGGTTTCTSGTPVDEIILDFDLFKARPQERCSPDFRLLHGLVAASVERVSVLMGDGRRRTPATVKLEDGTRRAWGLGIAPGDAVRSVTLTSAGGRSRTLRQALAPVALNCAALGDRDGFTDYAIGFTDGLPALTPPGPVTTIPGAPAIRVADGPAETLCLAVGDTPFTAIGCELVPAIAGEVLRVVDSIEHTRAVAFAVPVAVASIRLSSADGKVVRSIPTVGAESYAGRYAGGVRFAAATVSGYEALTRLELLAPDGRVLHREDALGSPGGRPEPRRLPAKRLAGQAGKPSLWQSATRYGAETLRCLSLTAGPRPGEDECDSYRSAVLLDASCVTHRLTVAVAVRSGMRVLAEVGTAGSRRRVKLRNGAGLLTLRAQDSLRALAFVRNGRTRRVRLNAPPAARQCGWHSAPDVESR